MTTSRSRGMATVMFLRLCSRAPRTTSCSCGIGCHCRADAGNRTDVRAIVRVRCTSGRPQSPQETLRRWQVAPHPRSSLASGRIEDPTTERRAMSGETSDAPDDRVRESRRQLMRDAVAIAAYALPVGLVYGLAALQAHFTLLEVVVSCLVVLAGGAQFAAAGMVKD